MAKAQSKVEVKAEKSTSTSKDSAAESKAASKDSGERQNATKTTNDAKAKERLSTPNVRYAVVGLGHIAHRAVVTVRRGAAVTTVAATAAGDQAAAAAVVDPHQAQAEVARIQAAAAN